MMMMVICFDNSHLTVSKTIHFANALIAVYSTYEFSLQVMSISSHMHSSRLWLFPNHWTAKLSSSSSSYSSQTNATKWVSSTSPLLTCAVYRKQWLEMWQKTKWQILMSNINARVGAPVSCRLSANDTSSPAPTVDKLLWHSTYKHTTDVHSKSYNTRFFVT